MPHLGNKKIFGILSYRPAVKIVSRLMTSPIGEKKGFGLQNKQQQQQQHTQKRKLRQESQTDVKL